MIEINTMDADHSNRKRAKVLAGSLTMASRLVYVASVKIKI